MTKARYLYFVLFLVFLLGSFWVSNIQNKEPIIVAAFGDDLKLVRNIVDEYNKKSKMKFVVEDAKYFNYVFIISDKYSKKERIPDLFLVVYDQIPELVDKNIIKSFDPKIMKNMIPLAKQSGEYKNDYYAYPLYAESLFLFYNKKFVKNKINDCEDLLKTINNTEKKYNIEGLTFSTDEYYYHFPWYSYFGGKADDFINMDEFVKERLIEEIEFTKNNFKYANFNISASLFKNEKAAMILSGNWFMKYLKTMDLDYEISTINDDKFKTFAGFKSFVISSRTNNDREIEKFFNYISSADVQNKLPEEFIPVNNKVLFESKKIFAINYRNNLKNMVLMPRSRKLYNFWIKSNEILNRVFKNNEDVTKTVNEVLENE